MKKILITIMLLLISLVGIVSAQNLSLQKLYTLLDDAIAKDPSIAEVVLETLTTYESTASENKKILITQIRTYVQAKVMQVEAPPVPAGYKVLPAKTIEYIENTIHDLGPSDAPIIVMEFLDFQCPYCKRQHTDKVLDELREVEFPGKVRTAAVNFPLTGKWHELATQAAESAQCAYIQGGIEGYYTHKSGLYARGLKPTMQVIRSVATSNGLDPDRMQACIDEGHAVTAVQQQKNLGLSLGVRGTPGSVILDTRNGAYKTLRGAVSIEVFMDVIIQLYNSK